MIGHTANVSEHVRLKKEARMQKKPACKISGLLSKLGSKAN